VIGKSRSTAVVLAYLVARMAMPLLDAWRVVRAARPQVRPNANFVRQLMRLELDVRGARSLTWPLFHADVLVADEPVDVLGWLRTFGESAPIGSERAPLATHAWVDALTVERVVVAPVRVEELLSLCAVARQRGEPMLAHQLVAAGARPHALVERRGGDDDDDVARAAARWPPCWCATVCCF
jgi:hypothetical protein